MFALSVAYDVLDNLNVELTWDRTFWSEYENLDFNFSPAIPGNPFEPAQARDWDDTDAFRIGLTYGVTKSLDLMAGFGYDKNPAPTERSVSNCPIPMPGCIRSVRSIRSTIRWISVSPCFMTIKRPAR